MAIKLHLRYSSVKRVLKIIEKVDSVNKTINYKVGWADILSPII